MVTVFAADGTIVYDSPAIERVFGYDAAERIGHNAFDYLHPEDQRRASDILERVLETPRVVVQLEVRGRRRDGEWRWLEVGMTNLLDDPCVGGIVANQRDITERRAVQEQLTRQADPDPLTRPPNPAPLHTRPPGALAPRSRPPRT